MGESFTTQLSTGVAAFGIPLALPAARGAAQPKLELGYSSGGGWGVAGLGWSIGASAISRQTDRGLPTYDDRSEWHPGQDRFVFGGTELVPICTVSGSTCDAQLQDGEHMPVWADGWQYFRGRIESGFLRFFWSPDHRTWRVQSKDGTSLELGEPLDGTNYEGAIEHNPEDESEIFRWYLVRQYDSQGAANDVGTPQPVNAVVYRYQRHGGATFLTDIFDTSPAANPSTTDLSRYAHHTRLVYETRPDIVASYRAGWPIESALRVVRVDVTSKTFEGTTASNRELVRRYHLGYEPSSHASLLTSVQMEGRCPASVVEDSSQHLPATNCPRLPAMTFEYEQIDAPNAGLTDSQGFSFQPFHERVEELSSSPPHSLGEELTSLMDVNADGLPDVLVTSPGAFDGDHGVFLNGLDAAGFVGFGPAQRMAVDTSMGIDAGVLQLGNPNVSGLDLDADGIANLVHMPRRRDYSVFSPEPVNASRAWPGGPYRWEGRRVATTSRQDVKIDFTSSVADIRVIDVNGDGLVDVVYSAPTEIQTFFALGRYPGGDDQFGQAKWTGDATADISNEAVTACSPWSATPTRFRDRDTFITEMNGDGLPDIARVRNGEILYWPGRGNGFWGTGDRNDCPGGDFAVDRHVEMFNAPRFGTVQPGTLLLSDVNGDGFSDMVEVRNLGVDIYLNENGEGWTDRHTIEDTPFRPSDSNYVALSDIDGSGTPDILWGRGHEYRFIDLTGGATPHLMVKAHNGLGKTLELDYESSTQVMLEAAVEGDPWQSWAPTATPVLVRSTVRDNLERIGRPAGVYTTEYTYRDPVYDGRQREFRGFREAIVKTRGDSYAPTSSERTVFLLGECPTDFEGEDEDVCSPPQRWQDNWREALKGLPAYSETFDEHGVYLVTQHTEYELRQLYTGRDGRRVVAPFATARDAYTYDTAPNAFDGIGSTVLATEVEVNLAGVSHVEQREVPVRAQAGTARVRSETIYDNFGNTLDAVRRGCIEGCPAGTDETITAHSAFILPDGDGSQWLWRETSSYITGSVHTALRQQTSHTYFPSGNLHQSHAVLSGTLPLDRFHATGAAIAPAPPGASDGVLSPTPILLVDNTYDSFGRLRERRGALGRCSEIDTDPDYRQLPIATRSFVGDVGGDGCGTRTLESTVSEYDRGLGLPLETSGPTGQPARTEIDGFGRVLASYDADPNAPGELAEAPTVTVEYQTTPDSVVQPYSKVLVRTQDGPTTDDDEYREAWVFVDGLGRPITTLSEADPGAGDGGDWVTGGAMFYSRKGSTTAKYAPWFHNGSAATFSVGAAPPTDFTFSEYDAFGRVRSAYGFDGKTVAEKDYHALSEDVHDAADLTMGPRYGTYATIVSDGHGRGRIRTERFHEEEGLAARHVINEYLPTGEIERVILRKTGETDVVRWMRYDSLGRMVLNVEPNTSTGFTPGPNSDPDTIKAFRYAYNDSGELVGTSDARGCGRNFHYDAGGRPLAEDRSPCLAHQAAYSTPNVATGDGTEAFYRYDVADPETGSIVDAAGAPFGIDTNFLLGRLVSVSDLASKSVLRYDARGRKTGSAVRIAAPGSPSTTLNARYAARWYTRYLIMDAADRPVVLSTGTTVPELLGGDGTSEVRYSYTARGNAGSVHSSYGNLVESTTIDAEGRPTQVTLGDAAGTRREFDYDVNRRVQQVMSFRPGVGQWTFPSGYVPPLGGDPSRQELLEHYAFEYDQVGNIEEADDLRMEAEWPTGHKPVDRSYEYDDLYRLTRVSYEHSGGSTPWVSPYARENSNSSLEQPSPHVAFAARSTEETFKYDWLGNISESTDDSDGFFDRSSGTREHGDAEAGPHQLRSASNRALAPSAPTRGDLDVSYDAAGNITALIVRRDGSCLPAGSSCWQRYAYEWNEVGELSRARRWDLLASGPNERSANGELSDPVPARTPDAVLTYAYDVSNQRVIKSAQTDGSAASHTIYVFPTLELRRTSFTTDYAVNAQTATVRFAAGPTAARVVYATSDAVAGMSSSQRVFLEMSDYLSSATFIIDRATGELVEFNTYQAYGALEGDYRPGRWHGFREPYKFAGKEEDIAVGLQYFGARYYSPYLAVWMSPDPATIHGLESDINPFAYVSGRPIMAVDPDGRIVFVLLAAAAIGAVVAAATSVAVQAATVGWGNINWGIKGVLGAAIVGAVAGAVSAGVGGVVSGAISGFGGTLAGGIAGGAAASAAAYSASAALGNSSFTGKGFLTSIAIGAATGAVSAAGGAGSSAVLGGSQVGGAVGGTLLGGVAGTGLTYAATGQFDGTSFAISLGLSLASSVAQAGVGDGQGQVSEAKARSAPQGGSGASFKKTMDYLAREFGSEGDPKMLIQETKATYVVSLETDAYLVAPYAGSTTRQLQAAFKDVPGLVFKWDAPNPDAQLTFDTTTPHSEAAGVHGQMATRSITDNPFYSNKALALGNLAVHETGHSLGLPDLYGAETTGNYMHFELLEAPQSFTPAQISAVKAYIADPASSLQHTGGDLTF
jgi:RHS repeat-associated protein